MNNQLPQIVSKYQHHISDVLVTKELPSGINEVYLIETKSAKFVLKNYKKVKPPYLTDVHAGLVQLIKDGAPIPPILKNDNGTFLTEFENEYYDVSAYIDHVDLSDQVTISSRDLELSGQTLAKLQNILGQSELSTTLKKVDFKDKAQDTLQAIDQFLSEFDSIYADATNEQDKHKLTVLKEIILDTNPFRAQGIDGFSNFLSQSYVPTHGDFSMVNILIKPDRQNVFVTDWDGLSLRPLVWDLQAALSLFSLDTLGNAYFMKPNLDKMKAFLTGYLASAQISPEQIALLPEVAKYNFAIYWLSYTLPAMIERDYRLLFLIPDQKTAALYWLTGFEEYEKFVAGLRI